MRTFLKKILIIIPFFREYFNCVKSGLIGLTFYKYVYVNILNKGKHYYPVPKGCVAQHLRNVYIGVNSILFRTGSYIQGEGKIYVGNYVRIANFCTLMSTNHDVYDHKIKHAKPIILHDYCWVGTHSIILAGVELGPKTIVGAGSVVTKSFPDGYCIIAGNPAKVIKYLERDKVVLPKNEHEYYGFIPYAKFENQKKKYLDVDETDFLGA